MFECLGDKKIDKNQTINCIKYDEYVCLLLMWKMRTVSLGVVLSLSELGKLRNRTYSNQIKIIKLFRSIP